MFLYESTIAGVQARHTVSPCAPGDAFHRSIISNLPMERMQDRAVDTAWPIRQMSRKNA